MRTVQLTKAGLTGDQVLDDVTIVISGQPPEIDPKDPHWRAVYREIYERDASLIAEALSILPGGTFDRLTVKLMERQIGLFKVAHRFLEEK